jgi:CBS domain-containing protein
MQNKLVRDLMISIKEYPSVEENASVYDALVELDKSSRQCSDCQEPYRAVLVKNRKGKIIGKAGQLTFLKALDQNFDDNIREIDNYNLRHDSMDDVKDSFNFWKDTLHEFSVDANSLKISDFMQPITHRIDINATLSEAISKLIEYNTISILVTDRGDIKGIIRLTDIFNELKRTILNNNTI